MNSDDIIRQGLGRSLFHLTWPMIFGVLALMSYQLVDAFWIAQLGVEPLAVLGFTLPVYQTMIGIQVGLGIATTAVISRVLGSGNELRARQLGGIVVVVGAVASGLLVTLVWLGQETALGWLGADEDLLPLAREFWAVWLLSAWLGAMAYYGYSLHRAQGDTRFPGLMMVVTAVVNMVLDPVFIFALNLGLVGAAWATIVAFSIGCLLTYPRLLNKHWLTFRFSGMSPWRAVQELAGTGAPAMLSQLMPALSATLATGLVATFGSAAVAAWGLGARLEIFSIVVVLALTMSLPPAVGRLVGAGQLDYARRMIQWAATFVVIWQLAIAAIWFMASGPLVPLVTDSQEVASILATYLHLVPLSFSALGVCMLMVSVSNALGMPLRALLISIVRLFACYLPMLWLGAQWAGMTGLLTGALIGNLLAGVVSWVIYRRGIRHLMAR